VSALVAPADPLAAGWLRLADDLQFIGFDDIYAANFFSEQVHRAQLVHGGSQVSLRRDLTVSTQTSDLYVRMLERDMVSIDEDLPAAFLDGLHAHTDQLEDDLMQTFSRPHIVAVTGPIPECRVLFSSSLEQQLLAILMDD
jgi:hypothetical protein